MTAPWGAGALLLELDERRLHELNETATAVWEALDEGAPARIAEVLGARYDVAPTRLRADVETALDAFRRAGLVGCHPGTTHGASRLHAAPAAPAPSDCYRAGQATFTVSCPDADLAIEAARILRSLRHEPTTSDQPVELTMEPGPEPGLAIDRLVAAVNDLAVRGSPDWVAFHAGAVATGEGVVLLPGPSNSGKSTLTAALVGRGAGYLSDEVALVDPATQHVIPYPKAIALDAGSFSVLAALRPPECEGFASHRLRKWHIEPGLVGRVAGGGAVRAVVAPTHVAGAAARLESVPPREAVDLLLANSFDFAPAGDAGFASLVALARTVPVYRLTVGELDEAAELVLGRC